MKILFDHQIFQLQVTGGVSKSFCEFIKHLPEYNVEWELCINQSNNLYLNTILSTNQFSPIKRCYRDIKPIFHSLELGAYWYTLLDRLKIARTAESLNKEKSIRALHEKNYDVFHPTYFNPYFLNHIGNKPFVLTIHDLIPEKFPQYFSTTDAQLLGRRALIEKASAIVAVSNNTKKDIIELYGIPEERITVIYHGAPSVNKITFNQKITDHPYFLFVGSRNGYKNFSILLQTFFDFNKRYSDVDLICVGQAFSQQEYSKIESMGLLNNVKSILASEDELEALYSSALALVYPSLYEGFGMPILEAFAFHCPVLTYPASSLQEVGGKAALYLDKDFSNFYELLEFIYLLTATEREHLIQLGNEHLQMFSWEKTAEQYSQVYHSLI